MLFNSWDQDLCLYSCHIFFQILSTTFPTLTKKKKELTFLLVEDLKSEIYLISSNNFSSCCFSGDKFLCGIAVFASAGKTRATNIVFYIRHLLLDGSSFC